MAKCRCHVKCKSCTEPEPETPQPRKPKRNFAQNLIENFQNENKPNEDLAKAIRNYLHKKEVEKQKAYIV